MMNVSCKAFTKFVFCWTNVQRNGKAYSHYGRGLGIEEHGGPSTVYSYFPIEKKQKMLL